MFGASPQLIGMAGAVVVLAVHLTAQGSKPNEGRPATPQVSAEQRRQALAKAQVWRNPAVPVAKARLTGHGEQPNSIACKFKITELGGTAPKFDCTLDNGDQLRVKYGRSPEIPSEVAAARLLHTLGFGADDVMLVEKLRCYGCPAEPFVTMKAVDLTQSETLYKKLVDYNAYKDFQWVAVERKHHGRAIGSDDVKGWAFFELEQIDAAKGGAPRSHVDALRLMAVFLAHWDNKSENQRLVCLSDNDWPDGGSCRAPFAMLQDVGSAFGPRKVDLDGWQGAPIWADRAQCLTSMDALPYKGATFQSIKVSEAGRRHLASLLGALSDQQVTDLFTAARFAHAGGFTAARPEPVAAWVQVFKRKVREISDGPACPQ